MDDKLIEAVARGINRTEFPYNDQEKDINGVYLWRRHELHAQAAITAHLKHLEDNPPWQPIETAPKDGTRILAWRAGYAPNTVDWNFYLNDWAQHAGEDATPVKYQPTRWQPITPPTERE